MSDIQRPREVSMFAVQESGRHPERSPQALEKKLGELEETFKSIFDSLPSEISDDPGYRRDIFPAEKTLPVFEILQQWCVDQEIDHLTYLQDLLPVAKTVFDQTSDDEERTIVLKNIVAEITLAIDNIEDEESDALKMPKSVAGDLLEIAEDSGEDGRTNDVLHQELQEYIDKYIITYFRETFPQSSQYKRVMDVQVNMIIDYLGTHRKELEDERTKEEDDERKIYIGLQIVECDEVIARVQALKESVS